MTSKPKKDLGASVRARLLNVALERKENFQFVASRFAMERFLYRLGRSKYRGELLLKGATLFSARAELPYRATRDLDFQATGSNDPEIIRQRFAEICITPIEQDDGITFLTEEMRIEVAGKERVYAGVTVSIPARLGGMHLTVRIDVGFGDAVVPEPIDIVIPSLLPSFDSPSLQGYSLETVIAQKWQAMIDFGLTNGRLKDYYDIWMLATRDAFDGVSLTHAIVSTFERRRTDLPSDVPPALTKDFYEDIIVQRQWRAFLARTALDEELILATVIAVLISFLMEPTSALVHGEEFRRLWTPGGPWGDAKDRNRDT